MYFLHSAVWFPVRQFGFVGERAKLVAPETGRLSSRRLINIKRIRVVQDCYAHANQGIVPDDSLFAHGGVYTQKAKWFDGADAGDHHMRCDHYVILDGAVVANVIAAPDDYVTADCDKWLNCIVFEDETLVSQFVLSQFGDLGADITDQFKA